MSEAPTLNIKITRHDTRAFPTWLLHFLIRPFGHLITKPGPPRPSGSPQLQPTRSILRYCQVEERRVEGIWIYDITTKTAPPRDEKPSTRIYYVAGGSFCTIPSPHHWKFCAESSRKVKGGNGNVIVSFISVPLAPGSPAPVTLPWLAALYKTLMRDEMCESVSFAGDSSGGNLVLSMVLGALREEEAGTRKKPRSVLLISPVVDLRFTNPDIAALKKKDPVLRLETEIRTAESWASRWELNDPRISPLLSEDLDILSRKGVKVHGVTGGYDILSPDTVLFREKCEKVGIKGEWLEWEKQMHCFPLAFSYGLEESVKGKDWIVAVLSQGS